MGNYVYNMIRNWKSKIMLIIMGKIYIRIWVESRRYVKIILMFKN